MTTKEELIVEIASEVHNDYCEDEFRDFFSRIQELKEKGITNPRELLELSCFDGEKRRNEIVLDEAWLQFHETIAVRLFDDYETFKKVFKEGPCSLKDFAIRELTDEEIKELVTEGDFRDYKIETGEENILRPFKDLSQDSKKENLSAALGAYEVYENLSKAGITIEQMETNPNIRNIIGVAIHTDWLKRNMDHENSSLLIPYNELDLQAKEQDLTVFDALLDVVKRNGNKYKIEKIDGYQIPNYQELEMEVLTKNKDI